MSYLTDAPKYAWNNRKDLNASDLCGCYCCLTIMPPSSIREWTDKGSTAICPYCGNDCIVAQCTGTPIETEALKNIHTFWLGEYVAKPAPDHNIP